MKDDNVSGRLRRGARVDQSLRLFLMMVAALATAATLSFVPVESPMAGVLPTSCGNAFIEPGEDCDPPGSITCPPGSPAAAFLPCNPDCTCPILPPTTTPTTTTPTTTTPTTTLLNHYQCYEAKRMPVTAGPVSVEDQFGTSMVTLTKPNRLCAPTNKEGEDPTAPTDPDHLKSWQDKHNRPKVLNQTIVNQFGTVQLDIKRPKFLLVPASKSLSGNPPPLVGPTVDHFQCYQVKRSRGSAKFVKITGITGEDQFGPYTVDLLKPKWLCAPANKAGEDPTAPAHPDHLLCYKTRGSTPFARRTAFTTDQFGSQALDLLRRIELCVPSQKNPSGTTTTVPGSTTTSSTGPVTTTSQVATTSTTSTVTTSTTPTTLYGSPSRAFVEPVCSLLD